MSRGLGDVYKRQVLIRVMYVHTALTEKNDKCIKKAFLSELV